MAANKINNPCQILSRSINAKKIPSHTAQMIVVQSLGGSKANVTLCQRQGESWRVVFNPAFRAVIGKNGIAAIGEKKEGDLKTPAGIYPIGEAFGSQPLAVKMDFKYITTDDKFIDDVNSNNYNRWVTGSTDAKSYEPMLIKPYLYGAVVN
jgi:L,D-peptidoglycan transpeptidase YkuD (ErfK/YbiS/YcfS/YnhG family)